VRVRQRAVQSPTSGAFLSTGPAPCSAISKTACWEPSPGLEQIRAPFWAPIWAPVRTGGPKAAATPHDHRGRAIRPSPDNPVKNGYDLDQLIRDACEDGARLDPVGVALLEGARFEGGSSPGLRSVFPLSTSS